MQFCFRAFAASKGTCASSMMLKNKHCNIFRLLMSLEQLDVIKFDMAAALKHMFLI
jgi:hypothetical protein